MLVTTYPTGNRLTVACDQKETVVVGTSIARYERITHVNTEPCSPEPRVNNSKVAGKC